MAYTNYAHGVVGEDRRTNSKEIGTMEIRKTKVTEDLIGIRTTEIIPNKLADSTRTETRARAHLIDVKRRSKRLSVGHEESWDITPQIAPRLALSSLSRRG